MSKHYFIKRIKLNDKDWEKIVVDNISDITRQFEKELGIYDNKQRLELDSEPTLQIQNGYMYITYTGLIKQPHAGIH